MEALKAIKIIGNQNDGRTVFLFLPNTGIQRVLNFMRDPNWRIFLLILLVLNEFHHVLDQISWFSAELGLKSQNAKFLFLGNFWSIIGQIRGEFGHPKWCLEPSQVSCSG